MTMTALLPDVPLLRRSRGEVADAVAAAAERITTAFLAADPDRKAGKLEWTVQQLAAHLATGMDEYASMIGGRPTQLTDLSQREQIAVATIAAQAGVPVADLVARMRSGIHALVQLIRTDADDEVAFYASTLPVGIVGGVALGELLVHGFDLAQLPMPADAAAMAAAGVLSILPTILLPGTDPRRVRLGFEVRGHGAVVIDVDGDAARLEAGPAPADVTLSAEPEPFLLASYQRISPLKPMLRRQLSVKGRPWKLAALKTRFESA